MAQHSSLTAERAHKIASAASAPKLRSIHVRQEIEEAARQGLFHKTFWPDRIGHQALPHSIIDELRADGFRVTHRDLGAVEVHWPEPAAEQ